MKITANIDRYCFDRKEQRTIKMTEKAKIFGNIDNIIKTVNRFKMEPLFSEEKNRRQNKIV